MHSYIRLNLGGEIVIENPVFRLVIYPTDDKHAIGFIVPATESRPARIVGLLKFENLEFLEDHANKILEYVGKVRVGGIPSVILNNFQVEG